VATAATLGLKPGQVPLTECLKDTVARVLPFWNEVAGPGHPLGPTGGGGSARQLDPGPGQVPRWHFRRRYRGLNIPNGIPLVYELDASSKPIRSLLPRRRRSRRTRNAVAVANQGKA
jgi:2,3-bisphosphoglycerate-dependent phosphoglycerate mutase